VAELEADHTAKVVGYYRKPESRLTYRLLGGTKHFGYYPAGSSGLSMASAMRLMEDRLGAALDLPSGSRVLDAGCGEGDVAVRLGTRFGLEVDGVDLLESNLRRARRKAARLGLTDTLRFHRLDYTTCRLPTEPLTVSTRSRRWCTPLTTSRPLRSCAGCCSRAASWCCSNTRFPLGWT
jgi:SAM-dependent methyltransferase